MYEYGQGTNDEYGNYRYLNDLLNDLIAEQQAGNWDDESLREDIERVTRQLKNSEKALKREKCDEY